MRDFSCDDDHCPQLHGAYCTGNWITWRNGVSIPDTSVVFWRSLKKLSKKSSLFTNWRQGINYIQDKSLENTLMFTVHTEYLSTVRGSENKHISALHLFYTSNTGICTFTLGRYLGTELNFQNGSSHSPRRPKSDSALQSWFPTRA